MVYFLFLKLIMKNHRFFQKRFVFLIVLKITGVSSNSWLNRNLSTAEVQKFLPRIAYTLVI
jgi:hypothetical protein